MHTPGAKRGRSSLLVKLSGKCAVRLRLAAGAMSIVIKRIKTSAAPQPEVSQITATSAGKHIRLPPVTDNVRSGDSMKNPVPSSSETSFTGTTSGVRHHSTFEQWVHPAVILVATDLADLDRLTLFALQQATETGCQLLWLHVVSANSTLAADALGMPYYDPAGALDAAARLLEPVCAVARSLEICCHAIVREGNPAREIAAVARQFKAGRVLLGTRSRSRLGKMLLGSVAERVLHLVNLPVMTIGAEAHLAAGEKTLNPIVLHPTSLGDSARANGNLAAAIAATQGAKLELLYVQSTPDPPHPDLPFPYLPNLEQPEASFRLTDQLRADSRARGGTRLGNESTAFQKLSALGSAISAHSGAEIEPVAVYGSASIEILAEAHARAAHLIILGAHRSSIFESIAWDRPHEQILAHARCPVLTLPEWTA